MGEGSPALPFPLPVLSGMSPCVRGSKGGCSRPSGWSFLFIPIPVLKLELVPVPRFVLVFVLKLVGTFVLVINRFKPILASPSILTLT